MIVRLPEHPSGYNADKGKESEKPDTNGTDAGMSEILFLHVNLFHKKDNMGTFEEKKYCIIGERKYLRITHARYIGFNRKKEEKQKTRRI